MPNRERICRLCLKMCVNNFRAIGDNTKKTLDNIFLLKIDLSVSEEPIMCTNCAENLGKLFGFKLMCLYTRKGESENSIDIPKDPNIYGFCMLCGLYMDPLTSRLLVSLDGKEGDVMIKKIMLEKCFPELDVNDTKNPIICAVCHGFLEKYFSFVANCGIVEEIIKKYCEASCTNIKGPVELNDVLQFSSKNILSEHGDTYDIIKVEETFCDGGENVNEVEDKNETFTEMEDQNCNSELQFSKKNTVNWHEGDNKVETIKIEKESYEELKNEVDHSYENFLEMEEKKFLLNEEIEIKIDQHDFSSFQDDVVLPQPEATIKLSKKPKVLTPYQCDYCSYQSKDKNKIRKHNLVHKNVSEVKMHQCDSCQFQTKYKVNLKRHSAEIHKKGSDLTLYQCETCSYHTIRKSHLSEHVLIHNSLSNVKMYQCEWCSFQTKNKYHLKSHSITHKDPSNVTMYQCDSCPFKTKHKTGIKKHSIIHKNRSDLTMYQCETCSYQTIRKYDFYRHVLIHKSCSKVKMYQCESCSFQTKFKRYLKRHSIIHKSPSEVRIYQCDSCSFQTKHRRSLKLHHVVHKDHSDLTMYQCDICSFRTVHKFNLIKHVVTHKSSSEIKIYHCKLCSYQTKFKYDLEGHSITHKSPSEVKMYQCELCSFQTKFKSHFIKHSITHKSPSEVEMMSRGVSRVHFKQNLNTVLQTIA